ncbi:MAG: DUF1990 family protein [Ornithinimicrobium sp.]|jgi:uncharacterized protein (UPF0548 family)|uniref:DUF1990 family protein n=1 Tax=Ornithinimicrobium sp. TaxID=1977084 RepID=UPI003D9ACC61
MSVRRLDDEQVARLSGRPRSYDPTGAARPKTWPGFTRLQRSVVLRSQDLEAAGEALVRWRVHEQAGLRVRASDIPMVAGTVVLMRWGVGFLSLRIPCRVVEVIDEPRRKGFAYVTLVGHPEGGEEQFLLERLDDGSITFTITAVSKPASTLAKLGGPATRAVQHLMTQRYLRALDRLP